MTTISLTDREIDNEIINKILAGEKKLFEQLMRRHNPSMFRIGMTILNNDADVEDVMQTAYINAYQHLSSFRQEAAFGTWLKRIMINECNQQLKKRKRGVREDISVIDEYHSAGMTETKESPVARVIDKELGEALEHALMQVPEKYRVVFVMREIEQLSNAETAQVLQISSVNVKVRLLRAKLILRGKISEYYKNDLVFPFHLIRCDRIVNKVMNQLGI
ncbi:RNA polymerase sigma-70 factor (ECF subfamily) [Chitinophaga polysaccharea]|uniref:RNA polymerase sigma-70 factor (ECF subfamily) n=1 Tax=Chitinophaga polysaccharea TaxID=1293035 RepID=A0A561PXF9_9BACT|nr:RNA polymerase sigma factor [Chitinophaga polysaccharea]TWF42802.1 RNA polymerase sigma-70 factor (ECF subfamily) [Chitinophaga polysaccharea]